MRKMLIFPNKALYHKLDAVISSLGIGQTNNYNDRYNYATYFNFDNSRNAGCRLKSESPIINGNIKSSNKIEVERIFSDVFGYGSFVESGRCVEKSTHHASKKIMRILDNPLNRDGFIYQKVIGEDILVEHRCTIVNGKIILCWERSIKDFLNFENDIWGYYSSCITKEPKDVFSNEEIVMIEDFSSRFMIDFADLDIMRDSDGKIYILDVNETASFHIIRNKPKDLKIIAEAFNVMLNDLYKTNK